MGDQDNECVRDCLNGHPEAYAQLVRRYQAALLAALAGQLGRTEAEEAAQEAFVRAFFSLRSLRSAGAFFPWLLGIGRRVALEQRRRRRAIVGLEAAAATAQPDGSERSGELEGAIAGLPQRYQALVILRYYGGHTCAELAELLGLPLGTVTKQLSRAHALLRDALRESER